MPQHGARVCAALAAIRSIAECHRTLGRARTGARVGAYLEELPSDPFRFTVWKVVMVSRCGGARSRLGRSAFAIAIEDQDDR